MDIKKTAVFGGSFDPVHLGHLFLLHCAVESTDYERFVIIPAYMSNFKRDHSLTADSSDRLAMIDLALEDYKKIYPNDRNVEFVVSDYEINKGGVSYTIDTVNQIIKEYSLNSRLGLLIGDDHIERLSQWYKFDELKEKVEFLICSRNYGEEIWSKIPKDVCYKRVGTEETSPANATRVRENINLYKNDLPEGVLNYVREKNLYN